MLAKNSMWQTDNLSLTASSTAIRACLYLRSCNFRRQIIAQRWCTVAAKVNIANRSKLNCTPVIFQEVSSVLLHGDFTMIPILACVWAQGALAFSDSRAFFPPWPSHAHAVTCDATSASTRTAKWLFEKSWIEHCGKENFETSIVYEQHTTQTASSPLHKYWNRQDKFLPFLLYSEDIGVWDPKMNMRPKFRIPAFISRCSIFHAFNNSGQTTLFEATHFSSAEKSELIKWTRSEWPLLAWELVSEQERMFSQSFLV